MKSLCETLDELHRLCKDPNSFISIDAQESLSGLALNQILDWVDNCGFYMEKSQMNMITTSSFNGVFCGGLRDSIIH